MEEDQNDIFSCTNPDCSWSTDQVCVNGLNPPEFCPNREAGAERKYTDNDVTVDQADLEPAMASSMMRIPWGENFTESNLSNITFSQACRLIVLVGEPSSGKSTLYAALFDSFQKGPCGDHLFHSSRTPIGFERTCHHAREKSGRETFNTERTKSHEFTYYHLSVRKNQSHSPPIHLLFADVNGERYQDAKESDDDIRSLTVLSLAAHVFFIADGALLVDSSTRHTVKDDVIKVITRAIQNHMISENQSISIIITKWDEIVSAGLGERVQNFFIDPVRARFPIVKGVLKIASRSTNDTVPARMGIADFLRECIDRPPIRERMTTPVINRKFQLFKYGKPR